MGFVRKIGRGFERTFLGGAEREAAQQQREAAERGQQLVAQQFQQTQQQLQPFISAGGRGIGLQEDILGELQARPQLTPLQIQQQQQELDRSFVEGFQESPGQQFLREQGLRGIEGRAAGLGGLGGGARLRALTRFSQGLALQDFARQQQRADALRLQQQAQQEADLANRLGIARGLTGTGLGAATGLAGAGAQQAAQQAGLIGQQGAAQAAAETARANALQNLTGQAVGLGTAALLAPATGGLSLAAPAAQRAGGLTAQLANQPADVFQSDFFTAPRV